MRFKLPRDNDKRIITRFALFPITIDYDKRWLEIVKIEQRYNGWWYDKWRNIRFIDPEEGKS